MNALRRDLFERRLWLVVLVLIVAIVAVPVLLLRGHGRASASQVAPAPAPAKTTGSAGRPVAVTARHRAVRSERARNPFTTADVSAGGGSGPKNGSGGSTTSKTQTTRASASSSSGAGSGSAAVTVQTPEPTNASESAPATDSAGSGTSTTAASTPTRSTTATSGSGATTREPVATQTSPGKVWAIYSASVRIGRSGKTLALSNIPRLQPLPNAEVPYVMFMGVTGGGRQTTFALGAGVTVAGAGECRPDHARCSEIVLARGQTETLNVPTLGLGTRQIVLRVTSVSRRTTRSAADARRAYARHSAAGLCELSLSDPMSYDAGEGTLSPVVSRACRRSTTMVPFPGVAAGQ